MRRHIRFTNERGRDIRLEVEKHALEDGETKGLTYVMTGPTSTTEQTMTRLEGYLLASLLAEQMGYALVGTRPSPGPKRTGPLKRAPLRKRSRP